MKHIIFRVALAHWMFTCLLTCCSLVRVLLSARSKILLSLCYIVRIVWFNTREWMDCIVRLTPDNRFIFFRFLELLKKAFRSCSRSAAKCVNAGRFNGFHRFSREWCKTLLRRNVYQRLISQKFYPWVEKELGGLYLFILVFTLHTCSLQPIIQVYVFFTFLSLYQFYFFFVVSFWASS